VIRDRRKRHRARKCGAARPAGAESGSRPRSPASARRWRDCSFRSLPWSRGRSRRSHSPSARSSSVHLHRNRAPALVLANGRTTRLSGWVLLLAYAGLVTAFYYAGDR
jgi:hypothetical protein